MSEQMRKDFEEYMIEITGAELPERLNDDYNDFSVSFAWQFWQASRQSLVVKLPELFNATFCDAYEADAMKEALDDAGVKCE